MLLDVGQNPGLLETHSGSYLAAAQALSAKRRNLNFLSIGERRSVLPTNLKASRLFNPVFSSLDAANHDLIDSVILGDNDLGTSIGKYGPDLIGSQLRVWVAFSARVSPMHGTICTVLSRCTPGQVFKTIIARVSIEVATNLSRLRHAVKSHEDEPMCKHDFRASAFSVKAVPSVSQSSKLWLQSSPRLHIPDLTIRRNLIFGKVGNRLPNNATRHLGSQPKPLTAKIKGQKKEFSLAAI